LGGKLKFAITIYGRLRGIIEDLFGLWIKINIICTLQALAFKSTSAILLG